MKMKYPFCDDPNTACIVCKHVMSGARPILFVSHDEEDGMWEFMCGETHQDIMADARVISMAEAYSIDESIGSIADMPCGYFAERESEETPFIRHRNRG